MVPTIKSWEEYQNWYKKSVENPEAFWEEIAETFTWKKKWDTCLEWNFQDPKIEWFKGGKLNITENCLDRHLATKGNQTAIIWEPNDPSETKKTYTYNQVYNQVNKVANMLKKHGIEKGDRVCLYLPMIPELAFATLACARIGAIHSVVFAGFSAQSLSDRIKDSSCKMLITADGSYRGNKTIGLKEIADQALTQCPCIQTCLVYKRTGQVITMQNGRDYWWDQEIKDAKGICEAALMDSEDPLFILYTSGSTGKPKGVLHTTAGYMVYTQYSFSNVFGYKENEVYWCTADIGWITGHSYIVYGPLLAGATTILFEGVPTFPDAGRFWQIIEKYKVNIFYTAPTAIRALQACSLDFVNSSDLSSLRVIGSVGEPINKEAWEWYHTNIGKEKCALVDTWWQTETGGIMISPLAEITPLKPTYATYPLPGIQPELVDAEGNTITKNNVQGNLCISFPWPGMIRSTWGDHQRCKEAYFSTYKGKYFTGDGCKRDENGMYRITGRVDDVINVSGHRLGTAEVENAINEHKNVIESAVVGYPHQIKGQGIYAYIIANMEESESLKKEIIATVSQIIGPIAKPDIIQIVPGLPKTRSGKIMRRILRKIAEGDVSNLGDTSTLLDPGVVDAIVKDASGLKPEKSAI